jgi:zinc D-Ala-D-Ala carboxypeptidase
MLKYFKHKEFDSPDEPGSGEMMEEEFLEALDVARDIAGFPFIIRSGFRSVQHNRNLIKQGYPASPKSSHLLGWAADIAVPSPRKRFILIESLLDAGFNRIGVGDDYVHVDMDPNKSPNVMWVY